MRNRLVFIGFLVCVLVIFVVQALLVLYATKGEIWENYWLGFENIKFILGGACVLFPAHIVYIIWAANKKKVEWHWAIPLLIMPYMLGVTIQGLMF